MNSGFEKINWYMHIIASERTQGSFVKAPEFQKINDFTACNLDLAQMTSGQGHDTYFMVSNDESLKSYEMGLIMRGTDMVNPTYGNALMFLKPVFQN